MLPYIFATRGQAPGSVLGLFAPLKQRELRSWACQAWQLDAIPGVFNRATPAIVNQTPEQTAPGVRVPREEGVPWHDGGGEGTRTLTALRPTDFKSVVSAIPPRPPDVLVILLCGSNRPFRHLGGVLAAMSAFLQPLPVYTPRSSSALPALCLSCSISHVPARLLASHTLRLVEAYKAHGTE